MTGESIIIGLAGVLATAAPLIFAVIGETITERAGIINLSMNGTILLCAMAGYATAIATDSLLLGFFVGMLLGGLVAFIVAFFSINLKQSQVAVGFVLALLCRDLSYFLGNSIMGLPGPRLGNLPIPILKDIPILGSLFFSADLITYLSYFLIIGSFVWIFRTRQGLVLQGIGEKPTASHLRGIKVNKLRYIYTILGGFLIGLSGPIYSLSIKAGWKGTITGLDGLGWIALAITIFGGWNPVRAALGAYFFSLLQWLGLVLQPVLSGIPSQVLQVAPFPLMILTLLLVNIGNTEWMERTISILPEKLRHRLSKFLRGSRATSPASLGLPFEEQ